MPAEAEESCSSTSIDRASFGRCSAWTTVALALLCSVLVSNFPARAQFLYRQINLAEMTQRAAVIIHGKVIAARYEPLPNYPHIDTVVVTLRVAEGLKGRLGQTYTFRQFLPPGNSRRVHKSGYAIGEQLVLFLSAPSQFGLSSPLGQQQGTFHITADSKGAPYVRNEAGNFGLFTGVGEAASKAGAKLTEGPAELKALAGGPVPLEKFLSLIKELRKAPEE